MTSRLTVAIAPHIPLVAISRALFMSATTTHTLTAVAARVAQQTVGTGTARTGSVSRAYSRTVVYGAGVCAHLVGTYRVGSQNLSQLFQTLLVTRVVGIHLAGEFQLLFAFQKPVALVKQYGLNVVPLGVSAYAFVQ